MVRGVQASTYNSLKYSYSFDGINYTQLPNTQSGYQNNGLYSFQLDLSGQPDGAVKVYVKMTDGSWDTQVKEVTLTKDTFVIPEIPPAI
jgi:hypothetical protein